MAFFSFWQVYYETGYLKTPSLLNHACNGLELQQTVSSLRRQMAALEEQLEDKDSQLREKDSDLRRKDEQMAEAGQRHDTVVMQMTRLVEYHQQPFWKRWRWKQLPGPTHTEE